MTTTIRSTRKAMRVRATRSHDYYGGPVYIARCGNRQATISGSEVPAQHIFNGRPVYAWHTVAELLAAHLGFELPPGEPIWASDGEITFTAYAN